MHAARRIPVMLLSAIALASCGAGHGGSDFVPSPAAPATSQTRASGAHASLTIALPAIQPAHSAIDWASKPNLLSPATQSVKGTVGSRKFGPIVLSALQRGCESTGSGLSCSIVVDAAAGRAESLHLETYATASGTGTPLATSTETIDVYAGQANFVSPPVYGIAQQVAVRAQDGAVHQGTWAPEPIVTYGIDAAKQPIPSTAVLDRKGSAQITTIAIALSGFVSETLSDAYGERYACCGIIPPIFAYDGRHTGTETFTARAPGYPAYSTQLRVLPGSLALGTLITQSSYSDSPNYVSFVEQYAANARGNAAPIRSFILPEGSGAPFGEDAKGRFWVGNTQFSNLGKALGSLGATAGQTAVARDSHGNVYAIQTPANGRCAIAEFPAGRYQTAPVRRIDLACPSGISNLTVDRNGTIFAALPAIAPQTATILAYAPGTGSGSIAPTQRIVFPSAGTGQTFAGLDTDAAGNLYVLANAGGRFTLLEFAPGSTIGTPILTGVSVQSFAVDDAGDIYARIYQAPGPGSLDYFPAGSSTPTIVIGGSATQLYDVGPIVIPRS
jgi:hypothetical protein